MGRLLAVLQPGLLLLLLATATAAAAAATANAAAAPSILFLMVDEMDGRTVDPTSPQFKPPTPNLAKLAARGAQFLYTYSESPQCVPARSSMLAGRLTHKIAVWDNFVGIAGVSGRGVTNATALDKHCVAAMGAAACAGFAATQNVVGGTFIDQLDAHGYNVTLYGKMHAGAGLDRFPGELDAWPFTSPKNAKAAGEWSRETQIEKKYGSIGAGGAGKNDEIPGLQAPDDKPCPATSNDYGTVRACSRLLKGGLFASSTPNFLYCSILVPHPPYASNKTYLAALPALGKFAIPDWQPKAEVHPSDAYSMKTKGFWDIEQQNRSTVEHFRRVYFSMIIEADQLLGDVVDSLEKGGGTEKTFIVMTADHGEHNTENRQCGKNSFLEASSRIPLIIVGPGIKPGLQVGPASAGHERISVSLTDIFPTLMDMAGVDVDASIKLDGSSLLPLAKAEGNALASRKPFVVGEYHSVYSATGLFMVVSGRHKLITFGPVAPFAKNFPDQLFDLETDPWERNNLAAALPATVAKLQAMLATEIDVKASDAAAKAFDKIMFQKMYYEPYGNETGCYCAMQKVYAGFNETDATTLGQWGFACSKGKGQCPDDNGSSRVYDDERGAFFAAGEASHDDLSLRVLHEGAAGTKQPNCAV